MEEKEKKNPESKKRSRLAPPNEISSRENLLTKTQKEEEEGEMITQKSIK